MTKFATKYKDKNGTTICLDETVIIPEIEDWKIEGEYRVSLVGKEICFVREEPKRLNLGFLIPNGDYNNTLDPFIYSEYCTLANA